MKAKMKAPSRPDRDRMVFEVLRAIKGKSAAEVARKTYVSPQTIRNWRKVNGTRYPQAHTMAAVARVVGLELRLVRSNSLRNQLED